MLLKQSIVWTARWQSQLSWQAIPKLAKPNQSWHLLRSTGKVTTNLPSYSATLGHYRTSTQLIAHQTGVWLVGKLLRRVLAFYAIEIAEPSNVDLCRNNSQWTGHTHQL